MTVLKRYLLNTLFYDSEGGGRRAGRTPFTEDRAALLARRMGLGRVCLVLLSLRGFLASPHARDLELALAVLEAMEQEAADKAPGFIPEAKLLFVERVGLDSVCVALELEASPAWESRLAVANGATMLRLSIRDNLHLTFPTIRDPYITVSAGFSIIPKSPQETDRALYSALVEAHRATLRPVDHAGAPFHDEYVAILVNQRIETSYQPIVDFASGKVLGWEALSACPTSASFDHFIALLRFAEETDTVPALDTLCRELALQRLGELGHGQKLFLNIHPETILQDMATPEETMVLLEQYGLAPRDIVLELSEDRCRVETEALTNRLEQFKLRGMGVALDDVGAACPDLRFIARLKPDYVKVDISLIGGIDTNPIHRTVAQALACMAGEMEASLIAVGIERETEYSFLVSMGFAAGQGRYLAPPATVKTDRLFTVPAKACFGANALTLKCAMAIRDLAEPTTAVDPDATVREVRRRLEDKPPMSNVVVVRNKRPIGLVMKYTLDYHLSSQFGQSLYLHRPISRIMDTSCLVVDANEAVEEVARLAMQRQSEKIYDDILVVEEGELLGVVSVQGMLDKMAKLQVEMAKGANPLTGLPGNVAIETEIERRAAAKTPTAFVYVDLDNFKVYNDVYGFDSGDRIILAVARAMNHALATAGGPEDWVGHVGGDDFIAFTEPDRVDELCALAIEQFAGESHTFYTQEDLAHGKMQGVDRDGRPREFPLVSVSIGSLICDFTAPFSISELSRKVATVKKLAKAEAGDSCVSMRWSVETP